MIILNVHILVTAMIILVVVVFEHLIIRRHLLHGIRELSDRVVSLMIIATRQCTTCIDQLVRRISVSIWLLDIRISSHSGCPAEF